MISLLYLEAYTMFGHSHLDQSYSLFKQAYFIIVSLASAASDAGGSIDGRRWTKVALPTAQEIKLA
jgi:hypothetical protein